MKPGIILSGDEQARSLFLAMGQTPFIANAFRVFYRSTAGPTEPIPPEELDACRILFEQQGQGSAVDSLRVRPDCERITFPRLTFKALWPSVCINTYGGFPYGDRIVIQGLNRGLSADAIRASVVADLDVDHRQDAADALAIESARLAALDSACDVRIGEYVVANFPSRRLFWAPDVPADALLSELLSRLVAAAFEAGAGASPVLTAPGVSVPIHPRVAECLKLEWFDPAESYRLPDGTAVTYVQYFERMITAGTKVRQARPTVEMPSVEPNIIVYGNCQADALALVLSRLKLPGTRRVLYLPSYDKPGGWDPLREADVRACEVLFEQHDPKSFPLGRLLPPECRTVKFPSLDFNLLWPLSCVNPYNRPEPSFPDGRYPYGDSLVVHGVEDGLSRDEILSLVLSNSWQEHWHDLDRLLRIEEGRLHARDSHCDVKIGPFVMGSFRKTRLFWTPNHPTNALLAHLCAGLLEEAFGATVARSAKIPETLAGFGNDLLGNIGVPIHPYVASHFGLSWFNSEQRYPSLDGVRVTRWEYFERLVDASLRAAGNALGGAAAGT